VGVAWFDLRYAGVAFFADFVFFFAVDPADELRFAAAVGGAALDFVAGRRAFEVDETFFLAAALGVSA
jgi:hypothetical protein